MAAFLLSLREGIEAALVVSILLSAVHRLGAHQRRLALWVWLGVGSAAATCLLLVLALGAAGADLGGNGRAVFEGVTLLLAAAVLTWMIVWMQGQGKGLRARLTSRVEQATQAVEPGARAPRTASSRARLGLFAVAFLAVMREGVELTLFLTAALFASSAGQTLAGATLGLAAAATLAALLFAGSVRLDIRRFFQVTRVILVLFAAGMLAYGIHELVEAGLVPGLIDPVWNTGRILSDNSLAGQLLKTLFGYNSEPALSEVLAYVCYYVAIIGGLLYQKLRGGRRPNHMPV